MTETVTASSLIHRAALLALQQLRLPELQARETKEARGARARRRRSEQLIKKLTEHIRRLPTPTYAAEGLRDAQDHAIRVLREFDQTALKPLSTYQNGLIVAPELLGPKKAYLSLCAQAAAVYRDAGATPAAASRRVGERVVEHWQRSAKPEEVRALLLAEKNANVRRSSTDLARDYLNERISKALSRHDKKNALSR